MIGSSIYVNATRTRTGFSTHDAINLDTTHKPQAKVGRAAAPRDPALQTTRTHSATFPPTFFATVDELSMSIWLSGQGLRTPRVSATAYVEHVHAVA